MISLILVLGKDKSSKAKEAEATGQSKIYVVGGKNGNHVLKQICCWIPKANLVERC